LATAVKNGFGDLSGALLSGKVGRNRVGRKDRVYVDKHNTITQ
jgi:hypothetical protein